MMSGFLNGFGAALPEKLSYEAFGRLVQRNCMNASQIRMIITQTNLMRTTNDFVVS